MSTSSQTVKSALDYVGGLGSPSKMPCYSYGISASRCNTGGKLQKIEGSVCSDCYACKGMYQFRVVKDAHERRYEALFKPHWAANMAFLINRKKMTYFRWHDSGDLQGMQHLLNIVEVANATPSCQHWLPTKELSLVNRYRDTFGEFPRNLIVRVSAPLIDARPVKAQPFTSTVHLSRDPHGHVCPAPKQAGKCGDCRACWDEKVANVSYHHH
ncbi:Gene 88 protein [uncultured Caudovirales phage]|uniref:Gene 88 protein n=1 Tax=uncultured Caudovirales phage TaxID=2100421 RepID=A0A6J5LGE2_9CAUD|nr:Gene 88 protein [uncultured Caudovirales phage]CAB4134925.1 Gene 88 protein [uncultured Caudovirales phage]